MTEHGLYRYTADMVVVAGAVADPTVLVCVRGIDPYRGAYVLPGGHVDPGETGAQAAVRELAEETGLLLEPDEHPTLVGVADAPGRDPRGPVVSVVYTVRVPAQRPVAGADDADDACWVPLSRLREAGMGFDHLQLVEDAVHGLEPASQP